MTVSIHTDVQIKQLNAPIKVKIFVWNAGGLLSRIEVLATDNKFTLLHYTVQFWNFVAKADFHNSII
jgi:hypothetical protein